jgi:glutathione synthase/RimK-type ligase-like ATP-grasp enzyme
MNKKIVLLTGKDHFFGQTRKPWVSINVKQLKAYIQSFGYEVDEYSFDQIANLQNPPRSSIVFYTFSQKENMRLYILSVIRYLERVNNTVIPNYDLLLCHENKGYQELYKKSIGLNSLNSLYLSSIDQCKDNNITYPVVLKTVSGTNAKGVYLIHSEKQLMHRLRKLTPELPFFERVDLLRRHYLREKKHFHGYTNYSNLEDYLQYREYLTPETRFVLQEFVPGLQFDYRVVIMHGKYFTMKRMNRDNDFRASGSKRFVFEEKTSEELLNYAHFVYSKFDTPFLSLDIGEANGKYYLFEYQALHFGISSIILSKGYYERIETIWRFTAQAPEFEKYLAEGLISYTEQRNANTNE